MVIAVIKPTNTENWYRSRAIAVTNPDPVVLKPLELVCGRNLRRFGEAG
jgi:hypothetical protein